MGQQQQCWWFLSLILLVRAVSHLDQQWHSWKELHEKVYMDISEEKLRRIIWLDNVAKIEDFNNRGSGNNYTLSINEFADLVSKTY